MANGRNFLSAIMTETAIAFGALTALSGTSDGTRADYMLARSIAEIDYSVSNVSIRISRCCDDRSGGRADGLAFRGRNEEAFRQSE